MFTTPIVYIFFNRPDMVRRTFPAIRAQRPARLYLIADGPRPAHPTDTNRCRETRSAVESMIDWDCEITRDYSEANLGCGRRLSSGLSAAFAQLGEAVVLEDDILPHPDFFPFCATELAQHRDDPRIHSIGGFNPLGRYSPSAGSTVPTMFNSIWGWASWQRAWRDYRFDISGWKNPEVQKQLRQNTDDDLIFQHYAHGFEKTASGQLDSWDYQWTFCMLQQHRHAIASSVNLIDNIGFSGDATHTHTPEAWLQGLHSHPACPTRCARDTSRPDRRHDQLYSTVVMSGSPAKITLARLAARFAPLRRILTR